jgi:purine-binding chemotaxis protein CheW
MRHVLFTLAPPGSPAGRNLERFAVQLSQVRTVVMPRPLSRIPRAPPPVLGIMNLRGRVVSVVDLARLLGQAASAPHGKILLIDRGRTELGLAVGEVTGIAPLEAKLGAPEGAPSFVTAVAQDAEGTVTLLDAQALDAAVAALFPGEQLG